MFERKLSRESQPMSDLCIDVGPQLNENVAIETAINLAQYDGHGCLTVDFSATQHFEPFAMLLVGAAVRQSQSRALLHGGQVQIPEEHIPGIAGHMGFWSSMGMAIGRGVNAPCKNEDYVPVSKLEIGRLLRSSQGILPLVIDGIDREADRLARVLVPQRDEPELYQALQYSLRELLRNAAEHSQAEEVWYAGMRWPNRGFVQVAVLDEGRGVRAALNDSKQYCFDSDIEAIDASLRLGVSSSAHLPLRESERIRWLEAQLEAQPEFYLNSGVGLYVTSQLARRAGQFILCSGDHARLFIGQASMEKATDLIGTALRMVLRPDQVNGVLDEVLESTHNLPQAKPLITGSMMKRLGLRTDDQ